MTGAAPARRSGIAPDGACPRFEPLDFLFQFLFQRNVPIYFDGATMRDGRARRALWPRGTRCFGNAEMTLGFVDGRDRNGLEGAAAFRLLG